MKNHWKKNQINKQQKNKAVFFSVSFRDSVQQEHNLV